MTEESADQRIEATVITRAPASTGDVSTGPDLTAQSDFTSGEARGGEPTASDAVTGIAKDEQGLIPTVTIERTSEGLRKLKDMLRGEKFAEAERATKLAVKHEFELITGGVQTAVQPTISRGRLYLGAKTATGYQVGTGVTSGVNFAGKRVNGQTVTGLENVSIRKGGATTTALDDTDISRLFAAAMAQTWSGQGTMGVNAPHLKTPDQESAFRSRVERDSGCLHQAALVPLIGSCLGWLVHMGGDLTKRTRDGWFNKQVDFAIVGARHEGVTSGMNWASLNIMLNSAQTYSHDILGTDYAGRLTVSSTFARQAMAHGPALAGGEEENKGRYLLAIPNCSDSVAAAALALTYGKPKYGGAGHSDMMAMMHESGVGYIASVAGSRQAPPTATTFGRQDVVTIMGYALKHMAEGDDAVIQNATYQVAALWRTASSSAHDWTSVYGVAAPILARPFNEAAYQAIWDVSGVIDDKFADDVDTHIGEYYLAQLARAITACALGTTMSIYQTALGGPTGIVAGDTMQLQSDLYHNIYQAAAGANGDGAQSIRLYSRVTNKAAPMLTSIIAAGLGCAVEDLTPPGSAYVMTMTDGADGCYYRRDDGQDLDIYYIDANYTSTDAYMSMAQKPAGCTATARGMYSTIMNSHEAGGVVDGQAVKVHEMEVFDLMNIQFEGLERSAYNFLMWQAVKSNDGTHSHIIGQRDLVDIVRLMASNSYTAHLLRSTGGIAEVGTTAYTHQSTWDVTEYEGELLAHAIDPLHNNYQAARTTQSAFMRAHVPLDLIDRMYKVIDALRAQLTMCAIAEDGASTPGSKHAFGQAAAIGIVGQGFTSLLAFAAGHVHGSTDAWLLKGATDRLLIKRDDGDVVPAVAKVAELSASVAHAGVWLATTNRGAGISSIGLSIVGDTTMPYQTVPWSVTDAASVTEDGREHSFEALVATGGDLLAKPKFTLLEPMRPNALYHDNKTVNVQTSQDTRLRTFGYTSNADKVGVKVVSGPVAHDYATTNHILVSTYDKGRKLTMSLAELAKLHAISRGQETGTVTAGTTAAAGKGQGSTSTHTGGQA